jgi:hypothetical protein
MRHHDWGAVGSVSALRLRTCPQSTPWRRTEISAFTLAATNTALRYRQRGARLLFIKLARLTGVTAPPG